MLKVIYLYHSVFNNEPGCQSVSAYYEILHLLTDGDVLRKSEWAKFILEFRQLSRDDSTTFSPPNQFKEDHLTMMTFETLDELKEFIGFLLQKLSLSKAYILSVQDYNIGLDGAKDRDSFCSLFEKYGEEVIIENPKLKNLFSKFF